MMKHRIRLATIAFAVSFVFLYILYYILSFAPFGTGTMGYEDATIQYLDFFTYYKNILSGKADFFYTMSDTLGGDLLSVFSYYLASPWNLLILFFESHQILTFFNLLAAIKISLCAATMSIFMTGYFGEKIKPIFVLVLSWSYAFMQYNIAQASNIMWLDGVYMLPLMILGVRRAVKEKKITLLAVSTALCILFNWYAAGVCCLFSIIMFFYESALLFLETEKKDRLLQLFLGTISYGGGMVISLFMSAALFLPTVWSLLQGKGMGGETGTYFAGNPLSLITNYHIGAISNYGNPTVYCGGLAIIGVIALFCAKSIPVREKVLGAFLLFTSTFMYYWEIYNHIFSLLRQATSYYFRYSYVSAFAIIFLSALFLSKVKKEDMRSIFKGVGIYSAMIVLLHYIKVDVLSKYVYASIIFALMMAVGVYYFVHLEEKKKKLSMVALMVVVCLAESGLNAMTLWTTHYSTNGEYIANYEVEQKNQISELKAYDDGVYRVAQTTRREGARYNESLAYNYWSNTGYTSCPERTQIDFLNNLGYRSEAECMTIVNTSIVAADSLLGVKYVLSHEPINGLVPVEGFNVYNGKTVYQNPYCLPMTFLLDNVNIQTIEAANPFEYQNALYSQILGSDCAIYVKLNYTQSVNADGSTYIVDVPKGNYAVYGNIPFVSWQNGSVNYETGGIFYGGWLSSSVFYIPTTAETTSKVVTLKTTTPKNFSEAQFYALDLNALAAASNILSSQPVNDIVLGKGEIHHEIEVDKDKFLYLSVPYSDGWSIKVNNQEVEPLLHGDCMMVLPLTEGKNVIDMEYSIPGLTLGIVLSVIGVVLLILWNIIAKNEKLLKLIYDMITSRASRYIIVGGCTTMVNLVVFTILCKVLHFEVNLSNVISILCAIFFAYVTNKIFVFESKTNGIQELLLEMAKFVGARMSTMAIEVGGVFLLYEVIRQDEVIAKLETQIIVLIVNYFISKFFVFKTKEER